MNDRLKQFLEMEGLTPTRFAELMEIQRSGISHLLAGRNKPSFEFIQKMMTTFPSLNYEWLILGKGKPYKNQIPVENPVKSTSNDPEISFDVQSSTDEVSVEKDEKQHLNAVNQRVDPINTATEPSENSIFIKTPSTSRRTISRITIFYSDGTFEER